MVPRSVITLLVCTAISSVVGQGPTPANTTVAPSSFGGMPTSATTPTIAPTSLPPTNGPLDWYGSFTDLGCYSRTPSTGAGMSVFDLMQPFDDTSGVYMGYMDICKEICAGYPYMGIAFDSIYSSNQGTCYCGRNYANGERVANEECWGTLTAYNAYIAEYKRISDSLLTQCLLVEDYVLDGLVNGPPNMQPALPGTCVSYCFSLGLWVATMTNGNQCNCGSSVTFLGRDTGTCDIPCADGDPIYLGCGGSDSSSMYILGSSSIGCFAPPTTANADAFISFGTSTGEASFACIETCRSMDYPYAALSGGQCLCGADPDMSGYAPVDTTMPSPCTSECVDEKGSYCGGAGGHANIYRLMDYHDIVSDPNYSSSWSSSSSYAPIPDGPVKILFSNSQESDCPLYPCFWCNDGQMLEKGECEPVPIDANLIIPPGGPAFESYVGLGNSTSYYMSTHPCPASMWDMLNTTYARTFIQTSVDTELPLGDGAMSASFTAYGKGVDIIGGIDAHVYPMTVAYIHETGRYELVDIENPPPDVMSTNVSVTLKLKDGETC